MRGDVEGRVSAEGGSDNAAVSRRVGKSLIEEIGPLVGRHGVGTETLAGALEEALLEVGARGKDKEVSAEELRSCLLGLVLWKIFGRGPWIRSKTGAGHEVPLDVLVTAYAMWGRAVSLATRYGVDTAAAAEALAAAAHAITEKLAGSGQEEKGKEICDIGNYLFATYMNLIIGIAGKQGSSQTDYVDMDDWVASRDLSDRGSFLEVLESGIHCRELLDAMPPKGKSVAYTRHIVGYSWRETAGALGSSVNAAQKALSAGVRKALGTCMQELRRARDSKRVDIEISKKGRKKDAH